MQTNLVCLQPCIAVTKIYQPNCKIYLPSLAVRMMRMWKTKDNLLAH